MPMITIEVYSHHDILDDNVKAQWTTAHTKVNETRHRAHTVWFDVQKEQNQTKLLSAGKCQEGG